MFKFPNKTWIVGSLAVLLAVAVLAGLCKRHPSGKSAQGEPPIGWSLRSISRPGWHMEAGYLVDFADSGIYLTGKWYRLGPLGIQKRWQSRISVTNRAVAAKIWRVF